MKVYFENEDTLVIEGESVVEAIALKTFSERMRLKSIPDTYYVRGIMFDVGDLGGIRPRYEDGSL